MDHHQMHAHAGSPHSTNATSSFWGTGAFNIVHGTSQMLTAQRCSLAPASEREQQHNRHRMPSKNSFSIFSSSRDNQDASHTDSSAHNDTCNGYVQRVRLGGLTEHDCFI